MREKRKYLRSQAKETVSFQGGEGDKYESRIIDVSSGGLRVFSEVNIKTGSELSAKFRLMPNSGYFYVSAEAVWIKPAKIDQRCGYEVGVKFKKISTIPIG